MNATTTAAAKAETTHRGDGAGETAAVLAAAAAATGSAGVSAEIAGGAPAGAAIRNPDEADTAIVTAVMTERGAKTAAVAIIVMTTDTGKPIGMTETIAAANATTVTPARRTGAATVAGMSGAIEAGAATIAERGSVRSRAEAALVVAAAAIVAAATASTPRRNACSTSSVPYERSMKIPRSRKTCRRKTCTRPPATN